MASWLGSLLSTSHEYVFVSCFRFPLTVAKQIRPPVPTGHLARQEWRRWHEIAFRLLLSQHPGVWRLRQRRPDLVLGIDRGLRSIRVRGRPIRS